MCAVGPSHTHPQSVGVLLKTCTQVKLLKEVGFDYSFNYKTTSKMEALDEAAPDGIDVYWENVGGVQCLR